MSTPPLPNYAQAIDMLLAAHAAHGHDQHAFACARCNAPAVLRLEKINMFGANYCPACFQVKKQEMFDTLYGPRQPITPPATE